jgi:hypothetical protein
MTEGASIAVPEETAGSQRLAILLAMAMFVLVVDTSLMNVSISAVVRDLDTTVSCRTRCRRAPSKGWRWARCPGPTLRGTSSVSGPGGP